jgi:DNA-binding NarL/FixJ family response regulator
VKSIRVFHLDDHEVVRRGLAALVALEADMDVVGEASTVAEAMLRIPATRPDVAVLDVRLPDGSGIDVCRALRDMDVPCLMLTTYRGDQDLCDAILAGASGYMLKDRRAGELITAIRHVATGVRLLDPAVAPLLLARIRNGTRPDPRLETLSDQERRILELIGSGMTNRQIGENMHLAEKTVKNYVSSLLAKLGMERRTQAATFVTRINIDQRNHNGDRRSPWVSASLSLANPRAS